MKCSLKKTDEGGNKDEEAMLYSVILPTYNERENLPIIYYLLDKTFNEAKLSYEVVIVDDSSPDNTLEVAQAIQESYGEKHVQIVSRKGKLGLGTAYVSSNSDSISRIFCC